MSSSSSTSAQLSANGYQKLQEALDEAASKLPGCFLTVANATQTLFSRQSGPFDVLNREDSPGVNIDTIVWLSSATRFIVSCAYLQLVGRAKIRLESYIDEYSPEFAEVSKSILTGFDNHGQPTFEPNNERITLRQMLNGTGGFGAEYSKEITQWKAWTKKGGGNVNSTKVEDLVYIPPIARPGERWEYGISIDWLSYIFPQVAGQDLESYLQQNIFHPLGIHSATFYAHESDLADRVMPLTWRTVKEDGTSQFAAWAGQQASHWLPKRRADIEYPVGGAGLYSSVHDFARLLQNILAGYQVQEGSISEPQDFVPLLSPEAYKLALSADIDESQKVGLADMMNSYFILSAEEGDVLVTTADMNATLSNLPLYGGKKAKGGWGRRSGSAGWGGAAGTDFYLDPTTGIIVVFTTQALPGSSPDMKMLKKTIEKAVYGALASA